MKRKRPERIPFIVGKGVLTPADGLAASKLRARNYHIGDVVFAEIKKPRNPKFHRLAHALGALAAENINSFEGYDGHKVLKRLQMESGIGCEEIEYQLAGEKVIQKVPYSLSFESMEQGEFEEVFKGMCRHLAKEYWPSLEPEKIEEMAELMVQE